MDIPVGICFYFYKIKLWHVLKILVVEIMAASLNSGAHTGDPGTYQKKLSEISLSQK